MTNNAAIIEITIGTVGISLLKIRSPSMADETEIGGVMMPSASNAAPPIIAGKSNHLVFVLRTKAYNENIPPSPLLSARKVRTTYLNVV